MTWTRRDVIKGMGAATVIAPFGIGCGSSGTVDAMFVHGVASGDPLADGVILWTRITTESTGTISVDWEVATDVDFATIVTDGATETDASRDYTVKVDVSGLSPATTYYYRFLVGERTSMIGRTKTAPEGMIDRARIAVCSCASLGHGYFHAYRHMAERSDLDLVLHLGDYIYEYGNDDGFPDAEDQLRLYEPVHEITTLHDYRTRYSQYRRDPDLQALHQQVAFVAVWDDHESANNSYRDGAENHQSTTEGSWTDRLAAARQAYFEWLPIRETPMRRIYRSFSYGGLADLIMLDTRIDGREEQGPTVVQPGDLTLPEEIISATQESWLQDQISNSTARWKLLGQQVVMGLWKLGPAYANGDQWNGYPVGRDRLMTWLRDNDVDNLVVLTGDVHSSWAMDVTKDDGSYNPTTREGALAVEFVAPGVTSPLEISSLIVDAIVADSPHIRFVDPARRGYFVLDVRPDKVQADWYLLEGVAENEGTESFAAAWAVMDGERHLTEMSGPEPSAENPPAPAPA